MALQENKLEQFSRSIVCSLWNGQHFDWCQLNSREALGGIALIWDRRVEKDRSVCGEFCGGL